MREVFQKPVIPAEQFNSLKITFENIPNYPNGDEVKVACWLANRTMWLERQNN
jgi:UDP-N-acetylmuramate dehydrogenase